MRGRRDRVQREVPEHASRAPGSPLPPGPPWLGPMSPKGQSHRRALSCPGPGDRQGHPAPSPPAFTEVRAARAVAPGATLSHSSADHHSSPHSIERRSRKFPDRSLEGREWGPAEDSDPVSGTSGPGWLGPRAQGCSRAEQEADPRPHTLNLLEPRQGPGRDSVCPGPARQPRALRLQPRLSPGCQRSLPPAPLPPFLSGGRLPLPPGLGVLSAQAPSGACPSHVASDRGRLSLLDVPRKVWTPPL